GIENIISIITGTEDEKIKEIKQDDFNILLDHSSKAENLTYILIVKKDLKSYMYIFEDIKTAFENYYDVILRHYSSFDGNKNLIFKSFDVKLKNLSKISR
ncbi:MAG: hypothetical protein P8Y97_20180, partial [Candidatus Lokiarchaeota archaeon]